MRFDSCPNDWSASHPDGVAEGGAPCTLSNFFFFLSIPRYVAWAGEPPGRFGPMHEKGGMFEQSTVAGSTEIRLGVQFFHFPRLVSLKLRT